MFMTNPYANWCNYKYLYINVTNLCNLATRYTFSMLILKLTEYTSYEVGNIAEVGQIS